MIDDFVSREHLKSSMDRFIEFLGYQLKSWENYLKSSMDRFIDLVQLEIYAYFLNLKSSMDRFIEHHIYRL